MAALADAAWGAYACVGIAMAAYAGLATLWVGSARRKGAMSGQWFIGGVLALAFVFECNAAIALVHAIAHTSSQAM